MNTFFSSDSTGDEVLLHHKVDFSREHICLKMHQEQPELEESMKIPGLFQSRKVKESHTNLFPEQQIHKCRILTHNWNEGMN